LTFQADAISRSWHSVSSDALLFTPVGQSLGREKTLTMKGYIAGVAAHRGAGEGKEEQSKALAFTSLRVFANRKQESSILFCVS
jgi:hypothetical protein